MSKYTAPSDFDYDEANGNPVGSGPAALRLASCTCCAWRGSFSDAVAHFQQFDHPITYRGMVQDFSIYATRTQDTGA